ncbi:enoyl-CoA hydratase/isomerase family protein [Oryzicola mucosus]|uniref:Enoyl-CoA hydratase/isomerase family protein n=1 Tax=Oryzicola mucosus TaxID=2767425 RepID=A0A8J6PN01_9HYPH|nr:enoyl-CoA hydratase/isomerase family protein [Oryzicola mucosus]MBD0417333.1 enoyl-CoA hydratase/isomerase family protein [Oryzicola mucosus]
MYKHPTDLVTIETDGDVAILTMNEPNRRNPFSVHMRYALTEAFHHLFEEDKRSRAIVLTGAGGHFCAGGDISGMSATPTFLQQRTQIAVASDLVRLMCSGPKPIVAAVEGSCIGAGLSLACAADVAVVGRSAKLGCTFVKMGLIPDTGVMWTLTQRAGHGKARALMLSGAMFTPKQAVKDGILDEEVPDGEALAEAVAKAREFAKMPPSTLALLRGALVTGMNSYQEAMRVEASLAAFKGIAAGA